MPRREDTTRVSLRLTQAQKAKLDDVFARTSAENLTQCVMNALAVYDELLRMRERGDRMFVQEGFEPGEQRELLLGFLPGS